jgi:ubiquitin carboxyl-terminal hydrolase L5
LIFLFKYLTGADAQKQNEIPSDGNPDPTASEQIFFAAQTIQNACGTQALLSVLLNQDDKIDIGPGLKEFKEFTGPLPPDLRGECLSNSEQIRDTHNSFARSSPFVSEEQRMATDDDELYHFIAYTPINGVLYELDGLSAAPISHGPCGFDEFPQNVIPVVQRRMQRFPLGEIRFNLIAMIRDPRVQAREIGDQETLDKEKRKRAEWMWENALRRHNFVGFTGELLKAVVSRKVKEGEYGEWVNDAKERTRKRVEDRRQKGAASSEED